MKANMGAAVVPDDLPSKDSRTCAGNASTRAHSNLLLDCQVGLDEDAYGTMRSAKSWLGPVFGDVVLKICRRIHEKRRLVCLCFVRCSCRGEIHSTASGPKFTHDG